MGVAAEGPLRFSYTRASENDSDSSVTRLAGLEVRHLDVTTSHSHVTDLSFLLSQFLFQIVDSLKFRGSAHLSKVGETQLTENIEPGEEKRPAVDFYSSRDKGSILGGAVARSRPQTAHM